MSHIKSTSLICLLSLSLFSCASKPLNIEEANVVIDNIESTLNDSTFNFPTKITINKLTKKSNQYIDKTIVRFSLDDLYFYHSKGFDETTLNEQWIYVNKKDEKLYKVNSKTENNKSYREYEVTDYNEDTSFFTSVYQKIKDLIISECANFKETLSIYETLINESNSSVNVKISSDTKKDIELDASISKTSYEINASHSFENYLPKVSNIYLVNENKEEKNFETKYYYNGVNITRPNIHNFK